MAARANSSRGDDYDGGLPPLDGPDAHAEDAGRDRRAANGAKPATGDSQERRRDDAPRGPRAADRDERDYAPVPLGGPDPDDDEDRAAPAPPPRGRSAASVRASMRPKDPWRRPAEQTSPGGRAPGGPAALGRFSVRARVLTVTAVLAAVLGVLIVAGPLDLGGKETASGGGHGVDAQRERIARLEAALRRESGQRYAWEMWAREFDPQRYRKLKRRAARRARDATSDTGG